MSEYHFGIPGNAVWLSHILMGVYFIYLGYKITDNFKFDGLVLSGLGLLALSYHAHLWYLESKDESV